MTKKLLVVAASGLVLAILLLSAAWVFGGRAMMTAVHSGGWHFSVDDDDHDHDHDHDRGATVTRVLALDAASPLTVDAPVHLHFVRGDHVGMTVSGPPALVSGLLWDHNHLSIRDAPLFSHRALSIEIVAPQFPALNFNGAGDISLDNLDQPALRLNLSGAGNVTASGRVHTATVTSSGAGNVDLGDVDVTDATVAIAGIGNIDVNASGQVKASVAGAGNVSLHRKPAQLTSQISGIGSIDQDY